MATLLSDPKTGTVASASSVLQRNTKLYGPMNAMDPANPSSSWNSEGGEGETISYTINFGRDVVPLKIGLQFQAGFSAETCLVYADHDEEEIAELELEDLHEVQTHEITTKGTVRRLKFVFEDCADFYNRVIIYQLFVHGHESLEETKQLP